MKRRSGHSKCWTIIEDYKGRWNIQTRLWRERRGLGGEKKASNHSQGTRVVGGNAQEKCSIEHNRKIRWDTVHDSSLFTHLITLVDIWHTPSHPSSIPNDTNRECCFHQAVYRYLTSTWSQTKTRISWWLTLLCLLSPTPVHTLIGNSLLLFIVLFLVYNSYKAMSWGLTSTGTFPGSGDPDPNKGGW